MMWLSLSLDANFAVDVDKIFSSSCSKVSGLDRSTVKPWMLDAFDGYVDLIRSTAEDTRESLDEAIKTCAPCSMHASATAKPMPDEPPMMRMREPESLEVYFVGSAIVLRNTENVGQVSDAK